MTQSVNHKSMSEIDSELTDSAIFRLFFWSLSNLASLLLFSACFKNPPLLFLPSSFPVCFPKSSSFLFFLLLDLSNILPGFFSLLFVSLGLDHVFSLMANLYFNGLHSHRQTTKRPASPVIPERHCTRISRSRFQTLSSPSSSSEDITSGMRKSHLIRKAQTNVSRTPLAQERSRGAHHTSLATDDWAGPRVCTLRFSASASRAPLMDKKPRESILHGTCVDLLHAAHPYRWKLSLVPCFFRSPNGCGLHVFS